MAVPDSDQLSVPVVDGLLIPARYYRGCFFRETTAVEGATALVELYDGTSTAGVLLDTIALIANESTRENYPSSLPVSSGTIYCAVVSGSVSGKVRFD